MTDFFEKLPKSRQHLIALAILFVIPLILFFKTTIGGQELQRHDITQWRAGAESIIEYREQHDNEPLWATNMFAGMPAYVISLINPVPHFDIVTKWFNNFYPAFQFWVMFFGMYLLLIIIGLRSLPSVFGSLLYGLATYFSVIVIAGHTSKLFALALIPWVFAGYWRLTRSDKKLSGLLFFAVTFSLEVRAGHPQITYYFMYLMAFLWLFDLWNAWRQNNFKNWGVTTALLVVGGVLGVMAHASNLLPIQEYAAYSIRGGSDISGTTGLDENYAFRWSQGITETLSLIVPNIFGGGGADYWGPKAGTSGPHYLGILSLPFLLLGLFKTKIHVKWVFFGTGTLAMFFAWGSHFIVLNDFAFKYIPMFSKFRAPETWLVVTAFCYSVVAAYGLDWLLGFIEKKKASIKEIYAPMGATAAVILVVFLTINSFNYTKLGEIDMIANQIAQQNQMQPTNPQVQQAAQNYITKNLLPSRQEKTKKDLTRLILFTVLGSGIIFFMVKLTIPASIGSLALILLVSVDMIGVNKRYMPDQSFVAENIAASQYIESQQRDIDSYIQRQISENSVYPYRVFPLLDNAFSNAIPSYFYPSLGGYTGAKLSVFQDVFMANNNPLYSGSVGINFDLLALMNVKYITYNPGLTLPGISQVFRGQAGSVYELNNVLPKAFFVDSVTTVDTPKEAYDLLFPGKIDFSSTAVVENFEAQTSSDTTSSVVVTSYTGPEMTIKTSRSEPGFLVLSEIYYPEGWIATLDGEEIPIYKTNYLLRGMQIPAGNHELVINFHPSSYYTGVKLGWASLFIQIGLFGAVFFVQIRKKNNGE